MRLRNQARIAFHLASMLGIGSLFAATQNREHSLIRVSEFRVPGPVTSLALSPDASRTLIGTSGEVATERNGLAHGSPTSFSLWTPEGRRVGALAIPFRNSGFHFLSSNRLLFTGDGTPASWDAVSKKVTRHPNIDSSPVLSPDRRFVVCQTSEPKTLAVVDIETGDVRKLAGKKEIAPRFTPEGTQLYGVDRESGSLYFWDPKIGKALSTPAHVPTKGVTAADISPDGRLLALAHNDGRITFVSRLHGDRTTVPAERTTGFAHFYGIKFSGAGRYLVAYGEAPVSGDGRVRTLRAFQVFDLEHPDGDDPNVRRGQPVKITDSGTCLVVQNHRDTTLWSRFRGRPVHQNETHVRLFDIRARTWWTVPWNSRSSGEIVNLSDDGQFVVTSSGLRAPVPGVINLRPPSQTITVYRIPRR